MTTTNSDNSESRAFNPPVALIKSAAISSMDAYRGLCDEAERDFEEFWSRLARENLD